MSGSKGLASEWRIEFASELAQVYAEREQVRMIVLGGSPSRGLSDEYSDVDMIVYWNETNLDFIKNAPLQALGGDRKMFLDMKTFGSQMELYYFGNLIFEVGHITLDAWKQLADDVLEKYDSAPFKQKIMAGFLDAKVLYGRELYMHWRERIAAYPDELAVKTIKQNLGFFWTGCILNQGLKRNEILFFYDALCMTMKRLLGILSGLNKVYWTLAEPRWIEYELSKMPIKPLDTRKRLQSIFEIDREDAISELEALVAEVIALVEKHRPEIDLTRVNESGQLAVRACFSKPTLSV